MRGIYVIFIAILILSISCQKEEVANAEISAIDLAAIDGMEKSYVSALQYNDSIFDCMEFNLLCANQYLESCDSLFHQYADEYEHHHNNYSHLNGGDDHHHDNMNQDHHGNGMMGGQNNQGHNVGSMDQLDSLLDHHATYH